jgi:pyruvate/2-oxoglutarate dehydrogenase complex dihydrolipoamide acyltransferase (E2) component
MPIVEVMVPQMGEGLQEVRVLRFLKQPGDVVLRDEHIYEMETDKAVIEVESPYEGRIVEWLAGEGDILSIGAPIAKMETAMAVETSAPAHGHAPAAGATVAAPPRTGSGPRADVLIPPRTRAHCRKLGLSEQEMRAIPAPTGKLMPEDVDAYLASKTAAAATAPIPTAVALASDQYVDSPLPPQQRAFLYRIKRSSQVVVPASLGRPVKWDGVQRVVSKLRRQNAEVQPSEFQIFAYCAVQSTLNHPKFRTTLVSEEGVRVYHHVNVGIAVAKPDDELVTALVPEASAMDFPTFVRASQSQIRKARAGQDQADASMQLLLTYLGGFKITEAIPVLVAPAVGVLFCSDTYTRDGEVYANLSLTFDHRLINGVGAAEYVNEVAQRIEQIEEQL